jgi:hypothetical protein
VIRGARTLACSVHTHVNAFSFPGRKCSHECEHGTHECVRHIARIAYPGYVKPGPILLSLTPFLASAQSWTEWGQNAQHTGAVAVTGQRAVRSIFELTYDPFVAQEQAESGGDLLVH